MLTNIKFITAILHIDIPEPLGAGIKVGDRLHISNNRDILSKILTASVKDTIGKLETEQLFSSKLYIYADWAEDMPFPDYDHMEILNKYICEVRNFFLALWMVKDNAAESELSFLIEQPLLSTPRISSNLISSTNSRHDISSRTDVYSKSEVWTACDTLLGRFRGTVTEGVTDQVDIIREQSRIGRAFQFVLAARGTSFALLKVANYCSALESLFCTDSQEISHKLAERVSTFLEPSVAERIEIFRKIKEAYGLRSKVIHGTKIKKEGADLIRIAATLDLIVRRVLNRIMADTKTEAFFKIEEQDIFEKSLVDMVFSGALNLGV